MGFSTFAEFTDLLASVQGQDESAVAAATARNGVLTKPPAALGRLEDIAIWYAGWRGEAAPKVTAPQVCIFAGNHGVAALGVSAFPAEVTVQMVANFEMGGAAINQLSRMAGAQMSVHPIDLDTPTADFTQGPAMSEAETIAALKVGWDAVDEGSDLLVVGEMGIGNTTPAAAISAKLFGGSAQVWTGRGTGVDDAGLARKTAVVEAGLERHAALENPLEILAALGGREIAAMTGAMARARVLRIPVVLDGFICCAAASVLFAIDKALLDHCVAGHCSAESAHARVLAKLDKVPLLDLGLRLGEGSGAALAINIVKGALECHSGMATFEQAGVSEG